MFARMEWGFPASLCRAGIHMGNKGALHSGNLSASSEGRLGIRAREAPWQAGLATSCEHRPGSCFLYPGIRDQ